MAETVKHGSLSDIDNLDDLLSKHGETELKVRFLGCGDESCFQDMTLGETLIYEGFPDKAKLLPEEMCDHLIESCGMLIEYLPTSCGYEDGDGGEVTFFIEKKHNGIYEMKAEVFIETHPEENIGNSDEQLKEAKRLIEEELSKNIELHIYTGKVQITVHGVGDSGGVEEIEATPPLNDECEKIIESLGYDIAECVMPGYENDWGGGGYFTINITEGRLKEFNCECYVVTSGHDYLGQDLVPESIAQDIVGFSVKAAKEPDYSNDIYSVIRNYYQEDREAACEM